MPAAPLKAALIADDLTGTNNAGVMVAKQGMTVLTVPYQRPLFPNDCRVACINTDSRYVAPDAARQRIQRLSAWALDQGAKFLCNRVDNLLRGNIGAEIQGMLDALPPDALAVVAPAFPALGRVISDGSLLVDGRPVTENPVAAGDPFAPVKHARIENIIAGQADLPVSHIARKGLGEDAAALAGHLEDTAKSGARAVIVDQATDADVARLAEAMALMERPVFPVDPGALSAVWLGLLGRRVPGRSADAAVAAEAEIRGRKILAAIGSVTPVTRAQVKHLLTVRGIACVPLDPAALAGGGEPRDAAIADAVEEAVDKIRAAPLTVLTTRDPDHPPLDLAALAKAEGVAAHDLSKRISDGLAEAVARTIAATGGEVGGCYASGGDVTQSLFEQTCAEAIRVFGEVIPLTAHVAFVGGALGGLQLVTKGGSIGDEDAAELCTDFLENAVSRR